MSQAPNLQRAWVLWMQSWGRGNRMQRPRARLMMRRRLKRFSLLGQSSLARERSSTRRKSWRRRGPREKRSCARKDVQLGRIKRLMQQRANNYKVASKKTLATVEASRRNLRSSLMMMSTLTGTSWVKLTKRSRQRSSCMVPAKRHGQQVTAAHCLMRRGLRMEAWRAR